MANEDSVTVSFRLNLNREEDWEIQRYLEDETAMFCFGDKSKFIKKALIRTIRGIKQETEEERLVQEINTQRLSLQTAMSEETDRIISAVRLIIKDEAEKLAGAGVIRENQMVSRVSEAKVETNSESEAVSETEVVMESVPCFGEIPEASDEDASDDVMAFLDEL